MKKHNYLILAFCLILIQAANSQATSNKLVEYVNTFIGTGSYDAKSLAGNNFTGATTPFGFVQLSPDTREAPVYPCSGYDYYDKYIFERWLFFVALYFLAL